MSNVLAIAAGQDFSLALRDNGKVVGWGLNTGGDTVMPASVSNVVAIAAGNENTVALKVDGTIATWGGNYNGETNVPVGLTNVTAVFGSGGPYAVALVGDAPPTLHAQIMDPNWTTNGFTFSFPAQSGRVYRIEYKDFLTDTNWVPLPLMAATGRLITATDPTATGNQRFYRIRRW